MFHLENKLKLITMNTDTIKIIEIITYQSALNDSCINYMDMDHQFYQ